MAARQLQPSEYEIQREVEALKDLRRRSTNPGALTIDPDLPNQPSSASPTSPYRIAKSPVLPSSNAELSPANHLGESSASSDRGRSAVNSRPSDAPNNPADDPLHLFWVPASLHPEIAPAEFRAFLKEHARSPPAEGTEAQPSSSASLSSSSSLSRKRSMLSRQYRPKENDGVEEENVVPIKRNRSLLYPTNPGPQLTISDLQKLEELAEEASESDDPSRLRSVLRRSLSLNISPTAIDLMDEVPDMGDEADSPIIVPPPGQILRRAARTKIRKPSLPGDGGGHRFGASRRGAGAAAPPSTESRTSSEMSSSDHGEADSSGIQLRRTTMSEEGAHYITRPESYSEETSIYDSYVRDDDEEQSYVLPPIGSTSATPVLLPLPPQEPFAIPPHIDDAPQIPAEVIAVEPEPPVQVIHQPQPQRLAVPQPVPEQFTPSRTPSPSESVSVSEKSTIAPSTPSFISTPPSTPPPQTRKEKEKDRKGLFGKWGSDKSSKKDKKDKENKDRAASEKEKESGFFGSLFGKKKQEAEYHSSITGGTSGREAAQALLGASKPSKSYVPSTSPGLAPGIGGNPYARYPIHVERAIYRLSHIKLANPRRPLYEQVLISNLMFWYLGVINKAQNPTPSPTQPAPNGNQNTTGTDVREDNEQEEKERREKEQKEKELKEKAEKERLEKEQKERELEQKKKESGRRGSLTKTPAGGAQAGRRAEMPVKGPQYEMQHRVMEQEYGAYNAPPPRSPTAPVPMQNGVPPQGYSRSQPPQSASAYSTSPPQAQPRAQPEHYYYQSQPENPHQRQGLPPGAMPPVDQSGWMSQQPPSPTPQHMPSNPPPNAKASRRSRSPPSHQRQQQPRQHHPAAQPMQMHKLNTSQESLGERNPGFRTPGRSLSATATSVGSPSPNGASLRKGNSVNAAVPYDNKRSRTSDGRPPSREEEDVPLAVWQQQAQRRR
ncbi:hypothetical protein D9613_006862 [Agrocybe pediades]|uniref:Protein Zds1 C-terminal domain-containing protein n=1 Tax=Agrocybe pediades TaxID=84607 RepID=A0A8H4QII3_9AGAR|nr:hypothetical protein D9613_006862 [Agrocybe pediades]KAF9563984.1 hypothetical protein CPC08DRAFT_661302 [Agrocybe pediades]